MQSTWGHPVPGLKGQWGQSLPPGTGFQSLLQHLHNAPVPWQSVPQKQFGSTQHQLRFGLLYEILSYDMMWHPLFLGFKTQYGRPSECTFRDAFNVVFTVSSCLYTSGKVGQADVTATENTTYLNKRLKLIRNSQKQKTPQETKEPKQAREVQKSKHRLSRSFGEEALVCFLLKSLVFFSLFLL